MGQRKQTRRELFLADMELVVPRTSLLALIEPHYPKLGRPGRQPYPLADHDAAHPLPSTVVCLERPGNGRSFGRHVGDAPVRPAWGLANIPDETTILNFRRLLGCHDLARKLLAKVNAHLSRKGLSLRDGTFVDATIIAAPSSTKNQESERDPEIHRTRKGNQWNFE